MFPRLVRAHLLFGTVYDNFGDKIRGCSILATVEALLVFPWVSFYAHNIEVPCKDSLEYEALLDTNPGSLSSPTAFIMQTLDCTCNQLRRYLKKCGGW